MNECPVWSCGKDLSFSPPLPGFDSLHGDAFWIFNDFCSYDCIVDIQLQNVFKDGLVAQLVARQTPDQKAKCSYRFKAGFLLRKI